MATAYTAQALRRYDHHQVPGTAGSALNPGDIVLNVNGTGLVGVVAGLEAVASGAQVTYQVEGVYDVVAASATTFSAGDLIYWDDTNNVAKTTATGGYQLIGVATKAKVSGELSVKCRINPVIRNVYGTATLDGSNPTPVTTGLTKVLGAVACIKQTTALGDDPVAVSVGYSGTDGTLNLYAWKTDGTDPTLVASTNNTATINWVAWGV